MKPTTWKTIAIIFIVLFILENLWIGYGLYLIDKDEDRINECYYEICKEYPDAWYEADVCSCYDYDLLGTLVVVEQEYMK